MVSKRWATIEFLKDMSFPRFGVKNGERWTFQVSGSLIERLNVIKNGALDDTFEFAYGQCFVKNVKLIYEGVDGSLAYAREQEVQS